MGNLVLLDEGNEWQSNSEAEGDQWVLSGCETFCPSLPLQSIAHTQGNEARALLAFEGSGEMLPSSLGSDELLLGSL